ncbi:MAG: hypothetical protein AAF546_05420 [Verrucomicrobiota bacterium]
MKKLIYTPLVLLAFFVPSLALAGSDAGDDSARNYKNFPEKYDGKKVDVDCTHVTRINGGPRIDDVILFAAHTVDRDNRTRGGSIVVAVLAEDAEAFARKFGTTIDITRGAAEKVDSKSLRGTFHMLDRGHVYIDYTDGEAATLIEERAELFRTKIRAGDGAGGPGPNKRSKRF